MSSCVSVRRGNGILHFLIKIERTKCKTGTYMKQKRRKRLVLSSEYSVVVKYGNENLEKCIERMIEAKKNSAQMEVCNLPKDSL